MSTPSSSHNRRVRSLATLGYDIYTTRTGAYAIIVPARRRDEEDRVIAILDVRLAETNTLLVHELNIERDPRTRQQGRPFPSDILLGFWRYHIGLAWSALGKVVFTKVKEFCLCDMVPSLYRRIRRGGVDTLAIPIEMGRPDISGQGGGDLLSNAITTTPYGAAVVSMMNLYRQQVGGIDGFRIVPWIDLPRFRRERRMRANQQLSEQDVIGNFDLEVFIGRSDTSATSGNDGDSSSCCSEED